MDLVFIFVICFFASILSSLSGGGSSSIILPMFLSMGISFPTATSIMKISGIFWVLPVAYNYLKNRKIEWKFIFLFSLIGLIGIFFSVSFIISFDKKLLEKIVGSIILLLVCYMFFRNDGAIDQTKKYTRLRKLLAYPFALLLGFYEGIFGSGNGIFLAFVTSLTRGYSLSEAIGYYFVISFFWVLIAAILLVEKGYFNVHFTIPAVLGSTLGGYVGSYYGRSKGNKFIKMMYVIVGSVLGLKLILEI